MVPRQEKLISPSQKNVEKILKQLKKLIMVQMVSYSDQKATEDQSVGVHIDETLLTDNTILMVLEGKNFSVCQEELEERELDKE